MPWPLAIVEQRVAQESPYRLFEFLQDGEWVKLNRLRPGSVFKGSDDNWTVKLPGRHLLFQPWATVDEQGRLWQVTGEVPNITVSPSIHVPGFYHGWIQNGTLTDDCDGRRFGADGNPL